MLCVLSNILGGCIRLHFNCDSEVPALGTGYTSKLIRVGDTQYSLRSAVCLDCRERVHTLVHTTKLCVFSNTIGRFKYNRRVYTLYIIRIFL